jgi:hypothetical protein
MQLVIPSFATHSQPRYNYLVTDAQHDYGREGHNYRIFENPKLAPLAPSVQDPTTPHLQEIRT